MTDPCTEKENDTLLHTAIVLDMKSLIDLDTMIILLHFLDMRDMIEGRDLHLQEDTTHQDMDAGRDHHPMITETECHIVHIPVLIEIIQAHHFETEVQKEGHPLWSSEEDQDHLQLLISDDHEDIGHIKYMITHVERHRA